MSLPMHASTPSLDAAIDSASPARRPWLRRMVVLPVLAIGLGLTFHTAHAADPRVRASDPETTPAAAGRPAAAAWHLADQDFLVELAADPALEARRQVAAAHYAIGVVALPVSLLQPQVAAILPFYLLLAAPWQAVFNARADTLARVLLGEPLPEAVMRALQAQWSGMPAPRSRLQVTLRLASYGLVTRSGLPIEAFDGAEDLCLVADGRLDILRTDAPALAEDVTISPRSTTRDAPPPLCASLSRWAADDARLLRQASREMAELLAAFIVNRAQKQR